MDTTHDRQIASLALTAAITEATCELPAVATLTWGDRAAEALSLLASPSWACVLIGTLDDDGDMVAHEATGVACGGLPASDRSRSIELTLRSRADRIQDTGLRGGTAELRTGLATTLPALLGSGRWRQTGLGQLWSDVDVADVVIAAHQLGTVENGRCLIAMVGLADTRLEHADPSHVDILRVVTPRIARRAVIAVGQRRTTASRWLTFREEQVLNELKLGKSVRQIAEHLDRSPHTVHDHVKSLHRKLNASSRGELIARALGYIDETARPHSLEHEDRAIKIGVTPAAHRALTSNDRLEPKEPAAPSIATRAAAADRILGDRRRAEPLRD